MGSLDKFSEAIAVVGQKREAIENVMKLMMREWAAVEKNSKAIQDLSARAAAELELKEKRSKAVVESVQASYEMLNSKKRWLEEGLKALDEKMKLAKGFMKEAEAELLQSRVMKDSVDKQLKELALREQQFQDLSETLKVTFRHVEERKNEMDSRLKQLEAREREACAAQQMLKKMKEEIDAEKKSLVERECLIALKEAALVERESEFTRKQKIWESEFELRKAALVERESEFAQNQKIWESEFELRKAALVERESLIVPREREVEVKEKLLEKRGNLMQSKQAMSDPRVKITQQPGSYTRTKSPPGIRMEGKKGGFGDGFTSEVSVKDSLWRGGKRRRSGDGLAEDIKACPLPKASGSDGRLQTKSCQVVVLDDSDSDSEVKADSVMKDSEVGADSVLKDTQKQELVPVRCYQVGQTWACFDAKDRMPRDYVKILSVTELGANVRLQVEWMKPSPKFEGEKEWISAGLPVGCGTFEPSRKSNEYPRILFQPMFSAGNPCIIVPFEGETWAIYKDWDIKTWSSRPYIHSRCKYEICEILAYPESESYSSLAVRVACLEKVRGSNCSFQRRSKKDKEEGSLLIQPGSLYRFSHKVPSSKSSGDDPNVAAVVFELDQNALPPGL